jgi:hypothetical protein
VTARSLLVGLMRGSEEWRYFFRQCCETSGLRLRSQARQWRRELRDRGQEVSLEDLEDALSDLARELMPGSPGTVWDGVWQREMLEKAEGYAQERMAELPSELRGAVDVRSDLLTEVGRAAAERSRVCYRAALRAWCQGVRDSVADVGRRAA